MITGPHRSGTTLVARLLGELGLWLGPHLDINAEAMYFLRRNEGLLRVAGGAWDRPQPLAAWLEVPGRVEAVARHFSEELGTRRLVELTGRSLLGGPRRRLLSGCWGFKDPRLLHTLPVWRGVFPGAPLVVVLRDEVRAAASLWRREHGREELAMADLLDLEPLPGPAGSAPWRPRPLQPYLRSARCLDLEGAHALWSEYASASRRVVQEHDGPVCEVRLEELVERPAEELARVAGFAGLEPDAARVEVVAAGILAERALAEEPEPEIAALRERLAREQGSA